MPLKMKPTLRLLLLVCSLRAITAQAQPCQPTFTSGGSFGDYIDGFQLEGIINTGTGPTAVPGYVNYQNSSPDNITSLAPGGTYSATITSGTGSLSDQYAIWVDLDGDLTFEPNELLAQASTSGFGVQTTSVNLTIPANAPTGYTSMRVMVKDGIPPTDPCGTYTSGETEDYTVIIDDGAPCIPMYYFGTSEADYIDGVQFGSINNTGSGGAAGKAYTSYVNAGPGFITSVAPGGTYPMTITAGSNDDLEYYRVWVDLDQSGSFEAGDFIAGGSTMNAGEVLQLTVVIPTTAKRGYTRMRVMSSTGQAPNDPCGQYFNGEAEDYTVVIDDGAPCIPVYTYGTSGGDHIDGVLFGGISNAGSGGIDASPYNSFVYATAGGSITSVAPGNSYPMTITAGSYDPDGVPDYYTVWVDLDHNGTFDPAEKLAMGTTYDPGEELQLTIDIPADAATGYTRMRVMCTYGVDPSNACGIFTNGETEDYTLVIDDGTPCIPLYRGQGSEGDFVSAVELNDLSWTVPSTPPVWGYESAMDHGARLEAGVPSQLTVTKGSFDGPDFVYVWIDWAQDGFDASDLVGAQVVTGAGATAVFTITPPAEVAGYTVMRVACVYSENDGACDQNSYGHAVDFAVSIGHIGFPCLPLQGYGATEGDGIESMLLQGASYDGEQEFPYYSLDNAFAHRFDAGASDVLQISSGSYGSSDHTLALDMNNDGDFSDANEVLGTAQSTTPNEVLTLNFTIPATCPPGQHYMRLRANYPGDPLSDLCDDSGYGSINDLVIVVEDPNGPCIPFVNVWTLEGDFIDGVQLGGAMNTGTGGTFGPAYTDYPSPAIGLLIGSTDTLHITGGAYAGDTYTAWIDYNDDNDFGDANESLGWVTIADPYTTDDVVFTVPTGTVPGIKRMRVRCAISPLSDACEDVAYGETEDYRVSIEVNTGLAASATTDFRVVPTTDGEQLVCDAAYLGSTFTVLDATGRTMTTGRITADRTDVPMGSFARGAYTIQLINNGQPSAKRFVW